MSTLGDVRRDTAIHIVVILCFIEHLCYPQGPAEMFSNVFILMECYLKLGPDVDYSDFYLLCLLLPNLIGIQKQKQKPKMLVLNLKIEKIHLQTNALMMYMFTNTEHCYNE